MKVKGKDILSIFKNKYIIALSIVFGAIMSFTFVFGKEVYNTNSVRGLFWDNASIFRTISMMIGATVFFSLILICVIFVFSKLPAIKPYNKPIKWYAYLIVFVVSWGAIFLSFLMAFRAYYPGITSYDFGTQAYYYFKLIPFTKHHPPLHSYFVFWAIEYATNNNLSACTPYAIVQIIIFSFILALGLTYLLRLKIHWALIIVYGLYFVLNPVIAIFSIITTKDIIFGGFFFLTTVFTVGLCLDTEKNLKRPLFWVFFDIVILLTLLFRNNALYAFILADIVSIIVLRKYWKRVFVLLVIPIILFFMIDKLVFSGIIGLADGATDEKLCVPMQQISYVVCVHENELTDDEIDFVNKYMDVSQIWEAYNPRFADPIKFLFDSEEYDKSSGEFWKGWLKLGVKYPKEYISSFLTLNIPYWYWGADSIDIFSQREYIEVDNRETRGATSLNLRALSFYESFSSYSKMHKYPILTVVFSIVTPIWVMLFCLLILLSRKQFKMLPVLSPAIFLWLTLIAGPVSNFRYIFPHVLLYPLLVLLVLIDTDRKQGVNKL